MSESGDFDPGVWSGHDFTAARAAYDVHVGRSYGDAATAGVTVKDLVPESIETDSTAPLLIFCDVTGSMGEWPATIFSKLGYLEIEGKEYLGEDMEIAFGAIGDAPKGDKYPLQIRPFTKGTDLAAQLTKLVVEGGGGGGGQESYDLAALYASRNVRMPKAINPILIIIGDEGFYEMISEGDADKARVILEGSRMEAASIFRELMTKYSVYLIRKPYGSSNVDQLTGQNKAIQEQWERVLGADRICMLPGPDRVVDVIFGILARETGRVDYFKDEITGRQRPEQVATVMKSLATVHKLASGGGSGKSVMKRLGDGKKTKSLI